MRVRDLMCVGALVCLMNTNLRDEKMESVPKFRENIPLNFRASFVEFEILFGISLPMNPVLSILTQ